MLKIVEEIKTLFSFGSCTLAELSYGHNFIKWQHEFGSTDRLYVDD
jgi:hypothetical protein